MATRSRDWVRVSKRRPCPVCNRADWCTFSSDGTVAICMRVESPTRLRKGGWLHKLVEPDPQQPKPSPPARPAKWADADREPATKTSAEWDGLLAVYGAQTAPGELRRHAADLGVDAEALVRLGACWAGPHRAWAFPMRDPEGQVVGVRLRAENGDKWAIAGSKQGLFLPDGQVGDQVGEILVCEGPTDTAAMLSLDFYAVGRPSCSACVDELVGLLAGRSVIVVSDNDEAKKRPDGSVWYPGQEGAEQLATVLFGKTKGVKVIRPIGCKDARAWKRQGATRDLVQAIVANTRYWRPRNGGG